MDKIQKNTIYIVNMVVKNMVVIVSESTPDAEKEKTLFSISYGENQFNDAHIWKVFL